MCRKRGKKIPFSEERGINTVFGPKYRPLDYSSLFWMIKHFHLDQNGFVPLRFSYF
jgi:hypothetical protein